LTGLNIAGGFVESIVDDTGTSSTGQTATLPTVAATITAMTGAGYNAAAGTTWKFTFINETGQTWTLAKDGSSQWTLSGSAQTIGTGTKRSWMMTITSGTAGTAQSLGEVTMVAAP
jgi:hypothetical protein